MGSARFPNKVMRPICGTPMIGLLLGRLAKAGRIDQIVLATSEDPRNESLARYVCNLGYEVYRGSEEDVLDRYHAAAKLYGADVVVRVTGDCPLIDPEVVDAVIDRFSDAGVDYASNCMPPTYPDGLDVEVFSAQALEAAWGGARNSFEREHVTPFISESSQFTRAALVNSSDESTARWTVDEPEDFEVVRKVFEHFHPRSDFTWTEVLALARENPEWFAGNQHLIRNE